MKYYQITCLCMKKDIIFNYIFTTYIKAEYFFDNISFYGNFSILSSTIYDDLEYDNDTNIQKIINEIIIQNTQPIKIFVDFKYINKKEILFQKRKQALFMASSLASKNILNVIPSDVSRWIISNYI